MRICPRLLNDADATQDPASQPALSTLRVATWDSPSAPGPVVTLRGAMAGWSSFFSILEVVKKAFAGGTSRPVAFTLVELERADPLSLSGLAWALGAARERGGRFRVLAPAGRIAEFVIPRLVASCAPYRVTRLKGYGIAFDT